MKKIFLPLLLLSLLAAAIFSLPALLSSPSGKKFLLRLATQKLHQQIEVEELHFSWRGPQTMKKIAIKSENFELSFEEFSTDLPFWKLSALSSFSLKTLSSLKAKTMLTNGTLTTHLPESHFSDIHLAVAHDENGPIHLEMEGKSDEGGKIFAKAVTEDLDFSNATLDLSCQDLPSLFLDRTISLFTELPEGFFSTLLGKTIQLQLAANIAQERGNLNLSFSSPLVSTTVQGEIQEGTLTLTKDLQLEVFLTETFSQYFLKEMSPLFLSAKSSKQPIHLTVYKEGFECPLLPFSLKEVKVQKAILDLGQMRAKNAAGIGLVMGLMKLHLPSHLEEMDVWATEVTLSLYDGTLYTDRMDVLLDNSIHICTWGTIDLVTKEVDMTLGLTADALKETFRFSHLPDDYVLTIPVKGTIDHVKIDNSVATAKIAKLMAMKATNAGVLSKLFGSIVQEENIPPPKRPFPWEGKTQKPRSDEKGLDPIFKLFQ
jgi:hypothetical protein